MHIISVDWNLALENDNQHKQRVSCQAKKPLSIPIPPQDLLNRLCVRFACYFLTASNFLNHLTQPFTIFRFSLRFFFSHYFHWTEENNFDLDSFSVLFSKRQKIDTSMVETRPASPRAEDGQCGRRVCLFCEPEDGGWVVGAYTLVSSRDVAQCSNIVNIDHSLTIHWPFIDDPSMIHWRSIDHPLTIHWPFIDDSLTIHWPFIDDPLMIHWPSIDHPLTIHGWSIDHVILEMYNCNVRVQCLCGFYRSWELSDCCCWFLCVFGKSTTVSVEVSIIDEAKGFFFALSILMTPSWGFWESKMNAKGK